MELEKNGFLYTDEKVDPVGVYDLLLQGNMLNNRSQYLVEESLRHSYCLSVYDRNKLVAFARVLSDYGSVSIVRDVILLPDYRHKGIAHQIFDLLTNSELFKRTNLILWSRLDVPFYHEFGFRQLNRKIFLKPSILEQK
ncbi:GNAT family N-acetyltransferase [Entomospira culicis]|uniref:GNAT family N-acetyltransferase n=1 Tax=Entomospira culicis TaxID=2719989 RepID=A0A968KU73_9SPIO|nr:GNAT family N-acetyltransferase [Entomospira culicis]NIZ18640.1 GNAT family N-acetyltransferase [Entomospira culicis]NIZ68855.1 GNAT family N-acetyltransferase [Entomospira culicis]WDI37449.1 GNAT family N-acetyltransferase [Entomospira culicis]WDI39077.1 GNAT family N-acetyltransferase [Entomospira culicis]